MATHTSTGIAARSNVQKASLVVGAVFLLVGVLGFVPGITANFDQLHWHPRLRPTLRTRTRTRRISEFSRFLILPAK